MTTSPIHADEEPRIDRVMLNDLIVYAERYAISRMSYANGSVADDILKLCRWNVLDKKTITVLIRDIKMAINDHSIPYKDQTEKWREVLLALQAQLTALKKEEK